MNLKIKYKYIVLILLFSVSVLLSINSNLVFTKADINGLTEQQLYNETNTYNVNPSCFNLDGVFLTTFEHNRKTNQVQYNISYDMSEKYNMNYNEKTI